MKFWNESVDTEREINTIKEAVELLNEESLEKLTLVYLYEYIVYNNHLNYIEKNNKLYDYKRRIKEIRELYRYKRIVFEQYRDRLSEVFSELTVDDFVDEIVAICIGFFKYENFNRWHRGYKSERMYDKLEEEFEELEDEWEE